MSLNEFFVQILESEQRAKQRKQQLIELQGKIDRAKNKLKDTEDELLTLKGQLAIKLQQLSDEELDLKWIRNKKKIMEDQVKELKGKVEKHSTLLKERTKEADEEREVFMGRVSTFISNFGLCGNGKKIRDVEANQKLEQLRKREMDLSVELEQLKSKQEEIDDLQSEKTTIMEEIRIYQDRVAELEQKIQSEKAKTTRIAGEKQCLAKRPETGQEYQRLQQELDNCKRDSLEGLCQALQPEVDRLQRQAWQRQIQVPYRPTVSSSNLTVTQTRTNPLPLHQQTRNLASSKSFLNPVGPVLSEIQPPGQWKSKQVTGTSRGTCKLIVPPEPPMLEDSPPEKNGSQTRYNEKTPKTGGSPKMTTKDEQSTLRVEEVLISDDEDLFEENIFEATEKSLDVVSRFPQKAKRVRFK